MKKETLFLNNTCNMLIGVFHIKILTLPIKKSNSLEKVNTIQHAFFIWKIQLLLKTVICVYLKHI